ncbi:MAG: hypothetical protein NZ602_15940 [Thermoguttaceae bacterium]|nr:hypothetical protein [Thermoguttaceae bacterium]MDW8036876.1 hypothetical protein [Thermoguttaceae bacterium]
MSTSARAAQFEKLFKILRKYYQPVFPDPNQPVLDHLLRACCLENASYQAAETALAALFHEFFDLNEVRVSTVRELSEVMACLPDPAAAAQRIKRILQHVFEENYNFSLEELRKGTLGSAIQRLQKIDGVTPFAVAYVVQSALGGHAIPIDSGTMEILKILGLVTDKDVAAWQVPGLERAIPKSKGIEFGSLLHQLGADFTANPFNPKVHEILLAVHPGAKDRLPKRRSPPPPIGVSVPPDQKIPPSPPLEASATPLGPSSPPSPAPTSPDRSSERPRKTRRKMEKDSQQLSSPEGACHQESSQAPKIFTEEGEMSPHSGGVAIPPRKELPEEASGRRHPPEIIEELERRQRSASTKLSKKKPR